MREYYTAQLETLNTNMIQMGALCEDAISAAIQSCLLYTSPSPRDTR